MSYIESMLESIPVLQSRDFLHILIYFLSSCDKYENILLDAMINIEFKYSFR